MANFMGPMAPPQAAPSQPPQLDIRTNPSQRAQFKSFMQGMQVPPTTAPVAPMLPAPTPMDDIDIFAPAPMADGGVVGGLNKLNQMSDQMVEALNDVVYGGNPGGVRSFGGIGGLMSSGGGFGGGQMPSPLPPIGTVPHIDVESSASPQLPVRPTHNQGGAFGSRLGGIGAGLGSIFGYEDGGPVGMFLGGDPRAYGDERGRQDTSETARERVGGTTNVFEGDSSRREERDEAERRVNEILAAAQKADQKGQFFEDAAVSQSPVNLFPGSNMRGEPVESTAATDTEAFFANQNMARDQALDDAVKSILAVDKTEQFDDALGEALSVAPVRSIDPIAAPIIDPNADVFAIPVMEQIAQEQRARRSVEDSGVGGPIGSDNVIFSGVEDTSVEGPLAEAGSSVDRLMVTPITNLRGGGQRTAGEDLTMRSESGIAKKLPQNIIENINKGRPAVIDARSGQITGYVGEGLFGIGNAYTGRPGYDPFGPNATFDSARNAYIVQPDIMGNAGAPASDDRVLATPAVPASPTQAPATPNPPMIIPPNDPFLPAPPQDVVVPSPRGPVNIGAPVLTAPSIDPIQSVGLPQSFLDLLANFNRPAPVAMQDGGAVLDKAADNFLEALKVA